MPGFNNEIFLKLLEMVDPETLGFQERLVIARYKSPYKTQKEVAKAIGIEPSLLSAYEHGRCDPSIDRLVKIAVAYDCSIDWLCGLSKEEKRR